MGEQVSRTPDCTRGVTRAMAARVANGICDLGSSIRLRGSSHVGNQVIVGVSGTTRTSGYLQSHTPETVLGMRCGSYPEPGSPERRPPSVEADEHAGGMTGGSTTYTERIDLSARQPAAVITGASGRATTVTESIVGSTPTPESGLVLKSSPPRHARLGRNADDRALRRRGDGKPRRCWRTRRAKDGSSSSTVQTAET